MSDLARLSTSNERQVVKLLKRSSRSHISGTMEIGASCIKAQDLLQTQSFDSAFQTLVSKNRNRFKELCRACYEFDFATTAETSRKPSISPINSSIMNLAAVHWRVRTTSVALSKYQVSYSMFCQGFLPVDHLYECFIEILNRALHVDGPSKQEMEEFCETAQAMLGTLDRILRTFFNGNSMERTRMMLGQQLEKVLVMIASVYSSPIIRKSDHYDAFAHIKSLLQDSLADRYKSMLEFAQSSDKEHPLLCLASLMREELDLYTSEYDIMIMEKLHLPTLGARVFFEPFCGLMENLANTYASLTPEMTILFELYDMVRKLQRVYESIDYKLAERFRMVKWFGPFVKEWLSYSERKLVQWVRYAMM